MTAMKYIPMINSDLMAVVDDDDYEMIIVYRWRAMKPKHSHTPYAVRSTRPQVYMHRLIMSAPPGSKVDHRDMNGLNNLRSNLRFATQSQQMANSRSRPGTSVYKGVSWDKSSGYWRAALVINGRQIMKLAHMELEAAKKYNALAIEHFGEFARLNEIP